jgi:endonuclease/exonuclease/phosphatase family metal-dependent hydrolase
MAALASLSLAGGCADDDAKELSRALLREQYGFSVLAINLVGLHEDWGEGSSKTTIPWKERYDRVSTWLQAQDITPDIIGLQEAYGHKTCPGGAADAETVLHLASGLRTRRSANYRVANIAVRGVPQGFCSLVAGTAIVYNADRLRNVTPRLVMDPVAADDGSRLGFHPRRSHWCDRPIPAHRDLCGLIDGPTFATSYKRSDGRYQLGPTLSIFDLVKEPGLKLHVYNEHLESDHPEAFEAIKTAVETGEGRFGDRLYPPIMLGDFNISLGDMEAELANAGGTFGAFEKATYLESDVMGILAGEASTFPARYPLAVLDSRAMPIEQPAQGLCSPIAELWSDHCAVFARFAPV